MEQSDPDNFPSEALNEILIDETVEQLGYDIMLHEYDEKVRHAKETIREALMATGDFQLRYLAEVVELEAELESHDIARVIADIRELLDHYEAELDPSEYEEFTQQYHKLHNVWLAYSVVVDSLADHLVSGYAPAGKRGLQLEIIECKTLSPDSRAAALTVIDELLPGEGLDLGNPDVVFAELENKRHEKEREERFTLLKDYVEQEIDLQVDFISTHSIHPADPAWQGLKAYLSRSLTVDTTIKGAFDMAMSDMVKSWLTQLHLSRKDYDDLVELVRSKIDPGLPK